MSRSGCQVAAMIDLHTESYVLWLRLVSSSPPPQKKKKMRERTLITLFQGREVLPCVSLYMLELCSYKHTHVRKECSLLLSFGLGLVTATEKSSKKPLRGF